MLRNLNSTKALNLRSTGMHFLSTLLDHQENEAIDSSIHISILVPFSTWARIAYGLFDDSERNFKTKSSQFSTGKPTRLDKIENLLHQVRDQHIDGAFVWPFQLSISYRWFRRNRARKLPGSIPRLRRHHGRVLCPVPQRRQLLQGHDPGKSGQFNGPHLPFFPIPRPAHPQRLVPPSTQTLAIG